MSSSDISKIIPQRAPFVMIDKLLSADEQNAMAQFNIREGHLLVEDGFFTEAGLVENMAQTAAAGMGSLNLKGKNTAPIGFIGAIKNLFVKELPRAGETIITKISFVNRVMNAHIVQASVMKGDREIAGCELKIFIQQ